MVSLSRGSRLYGRAGTERWRRAALAWGLLLLTQVGCAGIAAREAPLRNAVADWRERIEASCGLSAPTGVVVQNHGLLDLAANDPAGAARTLEARLQKQPEPDGATALAELSYQAGLALPSNAPEARAWFLDACTLSAIALGESSVTAPDVVIDLHNHALARLIRSAQAEARRSGRHWRDVLGESGLSLGETAPHLDPARVTELHVSDDIRVQGMNHVYRSGGLGVPLVVTRHSGRPADQSLRDEFLPRELRAGATAVVLAEGTLSGGDWRRRQPSLVFFDPFGPSSLTLKANDVALASDRSTPLALQVSSGSFQTLELMGLLDPGFRRPGADTGLYMLRPYEPGKIPVVFVHGLVSSPRAWAQTINELQNSPALAERYQFWVFLYPTGLPIPASASRLRESLTNVRTQIDPSHSDAALDRMVLVGHSMGGILSKMMAQDTGQTLWDATITVPHDRFLAPPDVRQKLDDALVFRPVPFVRRVVFIASPHRGSPFANELIGRVVSGLVRRPDSFAAMEAQIESFNGPGVISPDLRGRRLNAVGNLRTDSPVLAALDDIPIRPGVPYHSIIPQIGGVPGTDGVVEYRSSHVDGAVSEQIVAGTHFSQGRPAVTRELRRILLQHLEVEGATVVADGS